MRTPWRYYTGTVPVMNCTCTGNVLYCTLPVMYCMHYCTTCVPVMYVKLHVQYIVHTYTYMCTCMYIHDYNVIHVHVCMSCMYYMYVMSCVSTNMTFRSVVHVWLVHLRMWYTCVPHVMYTCVQYMCTHVWRFKNSSQYQKYVVHACILLFYMTSHIHVPCSPHTWHPHIQYDIHLFIYLF